MNILVTGGGGFIGSALVKRLVEKGHQVCNISRGDYPELRQIGVESIRGDLADQNIVKTACEKRDVVFHVAAKAGIWGRFQDFFQSNVMGTKNVIDACLSQNVNYLIFTSSASVVFDGCNLEGVNESLPYPANPLSPYTSTKALAEQMILKANSSTLKTLSLRPHLVWGPGDRHIFPRITHRAKSGKLRKIGHGYHLIDTTYIDNCIAAHICAAEAISQCPDIAGKAYFISNDEPLHVWKFIDGLLNAANLPPIKKTIPYRAALIGANFLEIIHKSFRFKSEPYLTRFLVQELCTSHWFDISAAKNQLGYEPAISNKEGFERLTGHFLNHRKPEWKNKKRQRFK